MTKLALFILVLSASLRPSTEDDKLIPKRTVSFQENLATTSRCKLCPSQQSESCTPTNCSDSSRWTNAIGDGFKHANATPVAPASFSGHVDYLWSTIGAPSMIVGYSEKPTTISSTNWTIRANGNSNATVNLDAIEMKRDFSFGFIVSKFFTFDKTSLNLTCAELPNGDLRNCNNITFEVNSTHFPYFEWKTFNGTQTLTDKEDGIGGHFNGSLPLKYFPRNATQRYRGNRTITPHAWLDIEFAAAKEAGSQDPFPHLPFSVNSTVIDFKLGLDVTYTNASDESVVLEVVLVSDPETANEKTMPYVAKKRSIDDEYTPSIFYTYTGHVEGKSDAHRGYVQWKPIAYTDPNKHTVENSLEIYMQPDIETLPFNGSLPHSAVAALYGNHANKNARVFYIIFHPQTPEESNPTYFSWSLVIGYGTPEPQKPSLLVYLTVLLGLGIPLVLTILSSVYVCYKKRQLKKMKTASSFDLN